MLIVSVLAFFIFVFLLATITVTAAWMGFLKRSAEQTDAERTEVGGIIEDSALFRNERFSTVSFVDSLLNRFDVFEIIRQRIAQAELEWSVGRVVAAMLLSGTVVLLALTRILPVWTALLAGAGAAYAPYGYILHRRNKRFLKFRENFPDVLDSLARALRAGYPLSASMDMIAAETQPPVSVEIRKTAAEANLGMGWNRALDNLGTRIPLLEVHLFASAVQLHARTGGKLSEVLSGLAENMREALALQGEVRSLAAHGKITGAILTVLPIGIAILMMFVSPGYMNVLFHYEWGETLIITAVICLVLAHFAIRKLVDIKI
jgi:tight adherence protein B